MKKSFLILAMVGLVLSVSSCKRTEIEDPGWDGPAGFYIMLDGSANPAVLLINGALNLSTIRVRATNSAGAPLANATLFFRQLNPSYGTVSWGRFENGASTIAKLTDGNGEAFVGFYSPVNYYSANMYIHVLMQVNGHAYSYAGVPQDYIAIAMVKAW